MAIPNITNTKVEAFVGDMKIREISAPSWHSIFRMDNLATGERIRLLATATLEGGGELTDEYVFFTLPRLTLDEMWTDNANRSFRFRGDFDYNPNVIGISQCGVILYLNQELEDGIKYYFTENDLALGNAVIGDLQYDIDYIYRFFLVDSFGRYTEDQNIHYARLEAPPTIDALTLTSTANNRINVDILFTPNANVTNFYVLLNTIDGLGVEYRVNLPNSGNHTNIDVFNGMMDSNGKTISITPSTTYEFTVFIETLYGSDMMVGIVSTDN